MELLQYMWNSLDRKRYGTRIGIRVVRTHLALDGGGEFGRIGLVAREFQQRLGQLAVPDAEELKCVRAQLYCWVRSVSARLEEM